MAIKKYTVVRVFKDKHGQAHVVGRQIEMDEAEAQPKVDSGDLAPVAE